MPLDPGGIPLRVRSHLARLRPEHKARLAAIRDSFGRDDEGEAFRRGVAAWLDGLVPGVGPLRSRSAVVLAGWHEVPSGFPVGTRRLDPAGRGPDLGFIGPIDPSVVGTNTLDAVIVVLGPPVDDQPWSALVGGRGASAVDDLALDAALGAVRAGGVLAIAVSSPRREALDAWLACADPTDADSARIEHARSADHVVMTRCVTRLGSR